MISDEVQYARIILGLRHSKVLKRVIDRAAAAMFGDFKCSFVERRESVKTAVGEVKQECRTAVLDAVSWIVGRIPVQMLSQHGELDFETSEQFERQAPAAITNFFAW